MKWFQGRPVLLDQIRTELEAGAFTMPDGRKYVTYDAERTRALIFTPPSRRCGHGSLPGRGRWPTRPSSGATTPARTGRQP
jgi:hypothetical protein